MLSSIFLDYLMDKHVFSVSIRESIINQMMYQLLNHCSFDGYMLEQL